MQVLSSVSYADLINKYAMERDPYISGLSGRLDESIKLDGAKMYSKTVKVN